MAYAKSKVELQLITDIDILNFVSRGIRGGVSFIAHRYAEANNPYIDNYHTSRESPMINLHRSEGENSHYHPAIIWLMQIIYMLMG